jgi:hypothetical protein
MTGYVYILTNPVYKGLVKVGKTSKTVKERAEELYTTGVPAPFEIYATFCTSKFDELEKCAHAMLSKRFNESREFFEVEPREAFDLILTLSYLLDDCVAELEGEIITEEKEEPSHEVTRRAPFSFKSVNIKFGEKVYFIYGDLECIVVGNNMVSYRNNNYSLSGFVREFIPTRFANSSGAYQGPKFFKYKGTILNDLRTD